MVMPNSNMGKCIREALINWVPLMVRQAHHERNQKVTVCPELVEGLNQRLLSRNVDFTVYNGSIQR